MESYAADFKRKYLRWLIKMLDSGTGVGAG
jgi:hypothetical protein